MFLIATINIIIIILIINNGKKFKNGIKVVVLSKMGGNGFSIGEIVTIKNDTNQDSIRCIGDNGDFWYIGHDEMKL